MWIVGVALLVVAIVLLILGAYRWGGEQTAMMRGEMRQEIVLVATMFILALLGVIVLMAVLI